jgi:hypothetical protein
MKPPVAKLLPQLQKEAREAAEAFAAAELKPEVVRVRMYEAARKGRTALRLRSGSEIDMRRTKAAAEFEAWCKENGFRLIWEQRAVDLEDGRRVFVFEPEISWDSL